MKVKIIGLPKASGGLKVENNAYEYLSPQTINLKGKPHSEGGTMIEFGGKQIEAERNEAMSLDKDGNAVVWGNMNVPQTKIKFKDAAKIIAEQESKTNKITKKASKLLATPNPLEQENLLAVNTGNVLVDAAAQRTRNTQLQKNALIETQNEMLEIADRLGIAPKKISKQLEAKMGKLMKKGCADCGTKMKAAEGFRFDQEPFPIGNPMTEIPTTNIMYTPIQQPITARRMQNISNLDPYALSYEPIPITPSEMMIDSEPFQPNYVDIPKNPAPKFNEDSFKVDTNTKKKYSLADKNKVRLSTILPELAILADRVDQIPGQQFNPTLFSPYQVSLQDRRNQNQSDFNALTRNLQNNPAAIATLQGQKRMQDDVINAEEFRINQGIQSDIMNKNVGLLNEAERINIGLTADQLDKQLRSKAITKDRKYTALASLANKYEQKRAENNRIKMMEAMTDYRYNPITGEYEYVGGPRSITPNPYGAIGNSTNTRKIHYDADGNITGWEETDPSSTQDILNAQKARKASMSKWGGQFTRK